MTSITFYGGISKIGGNCVVIEEKGKRIMLDNGMNFSNENSFYKDFLKPRTNNDLRDYLELGLVPKVPGIYGKDKLCDVCIPEMDPRSEYIFHTDLMSYEDYVEKHGSPYISALFISHCHLDHLRNIKFISPKIPIYCSKITKKMIEIICDLSNYDFLRYDISEIGERGNRGYFPGTIFKQKCYEDRMINIIEPRDIIEIPENSRNFLVKGYPVDHSVPGAMGFEVFTSEGKCIIYTGDIRFHGHKFEKQHSFNFLDNIRSNPEVLITEGTRIDDKTEMSEDNVYENMIQQLKTDGELSEKLIIASFPWKSITRFHTLYKIAKKLERTLVIQSKLAYTIHNLQNFDSLGLKDILKNKNLKIYLPRKSSMIYSNDDYTFGKHYLSYTTNWSRDEEIEFYSTLYGEDILTKAYEINAEPNWYILQLSFYDLNELIDIQPPEGSYYFNLKMILVIKNVNLNRRFF